jgi:hypothetical protein
MKDYIKEMVEKAITLVIQGRNPAAVAKLCGIEETLLRKKTKIFLEKDRHRKEDVAPEETNISVLSLGTAKALPALGAEAEWIKPHVVAPVSPEIAKLPLAQYYAKRRRSPRRTRRSTSEHG